MEKVKVGENLELSRVVHGLMRLSSWEMTSQEILELIEGCIELGVTSFDHADIYGAYTCEELFGKALALKPSLRERIQLVTKCGIKLISSNRPEHKVKHYDTSKKHIIESVERSLKNLETDYIDLLLIHRPDPFMNPDEVSDAFNQLKKEGKVLNYGVSNFKPSQFDMLSSRLDTPLVTNQIEVSPLNFENFDNGSIEKCKQKGIPPMVWSPLAGGSIFNSNEDKVSRVRRTFEEIREEVGAPSIDYIIYAWILNHPANMIPIVGSGKLERIKVAVEAVKIKLTRQQWFRVWESSMGREVD
ncbi:aldo/keto reductase [Halonatronum saccharophilum]|uniref:aldo/keto reductase n=1 Tax=Halonatronum saccharophilum TaxID=150060 RepID=UPI000482F265|nr:aldo/keto reductase [Halonatronum saccharophilum]